MHGKYSFWLRLTACLLVGLAITSYLIPSADRGEDWTPLFGVLGGISNILLTLSLLVINTKSVNNVFNPALSASFFLFIVLLDPAASYFSPVHPAVLLFILGQYCFISDRKFASMFFLSCSALCYAPLVWVLPLVLVISIIGAADFFRVLIKQLGGILLPFMYMICYRYMAYSDALVYAEDYLNRAMEFSSPMHSANFVSIFLLLSICVVAIDSISYMFRKIHKNNIITDHILKMEFMSLLLGTAVFFLFSGNSDVPLNMLVALPLSILMSHYFTGNINAATARGELIILYCAAIISRLYYFI